MYTVQCNTQSTQDNKTETTGQLYHVTSWLTALLTTDHYLPLTQTTHTPYLLTAYCLLRLLCRLYTPRGHTDRARGDWFG